MRRVAERMLNRGSTTIRYENSNQYLCFLANLRVDVQDGSRGKHCHNPPARSGGPDLGTLYVGPYHGWQGLHMVRAAHGIGQFAFVFG